MLWSPVPGRYFFIQDGVQDGRHFLAYACITLDGLAKYTLLISVSMFDDNVFTIITATIWNQQRYHETSGQGHIQGQRSNYCENLPSYLINIHFITRLSLEIYIFAYQNTLQYLCNLNIQL